MSQRQLAAKADVSNTYISDVERSFKSCPTGPVLARLAAALGVTVDYLLQTEKPPSHESVERFYPLPPKGYEDLSPEERKEVDEITRRFEEWHIAQLLEKKRRQQEK